MMTSDHFSNRWFYKFESTKRGPVTFDDLRAMLQRQELTGETVVWRDGMETWMPVKDVRELFSDGFVLPSVDTGAYASRPAWKRLILLACLVLAIGGFALFILSSDGLRDPFRYQRVTGDVLYEDGQPIPSSGVTLTFIPLTPPHGPRVYPRPGVARVDPTTGTFQSATTRKPGDGIVRGAHKVLVSGDNRRPLPEDIVPLEYSEFTTTPLEVDSGYGRINLKVRRPSQPPP